METELVDQVPEPLWEPTESSDDVSKDQVMVVNETNIASNDQEPISDSTGGYEDVFEPSYMVPDVLDHSDTLEPLCPGLLNDPIMSNTNDSMAEAPNVPEAVVLSTKPQCLDSPTEEPVCSPTDVSKVDSDGTDDQKTDSSTATKISTSNKKKPKKNKKRKGGW
ncbi:hypothetical protein CLU79DRAFT_757639 [Phycomyces nitens]|nr:hypothetical protein CLU79DRAFT_757639 [Phycomyces nitens]